MAWFDDHAGAALERKQARVSSLAQGDNTVVAAVTGKRLVVVSVLLDNVQGSAETLLWKSGSTTLEKFTLAATDGKMRHASEDGFLETASGEALVLNAATATPDVEGRITYVEVT